MKIMEYLDKLWDEITEFLQEIGEDIFDFVKPLAREIAKNGGALLLEAAHQAVKAAEATGGSGHEKFEAAQKTVIGILEEKGVSVVLNAVNGAIEAAVAKMKQE